MQFYFFDTKDEVGIDRIGGKGLSLIQMTRMGLNVPYGFILPTELWQVYKKDRGITEEIKKMILDAVLVIEKKSGMAFGDIKNPLIVSARSGAKFSMPGMMETILDIGITPDNLPILMEKIGRRPALSSYQQFLRMFGHSVLEIDHKHFEEIEEELNFNNSLGEEDQLQKKVDAFINVINKHHEVDLNNPQEILFLCIQAVLDSFNSLGAIEYRNMAGIPHDIGTAVVIQRMVFGNLSENSGSAVVFSRNFETGDKELTGHFLPCSQGENVVRGYSKPLPVSELPQKFKEELYSQIERIERSLKAVVDVEVTWEDIDDPNKVFVLQSRIAKVPPVSYFAIQKQLVKEGIKTFEEVVSEVDSNTIYNAFVEKLELSEDNILVASGSPLNTGVGVGEAVFNIIEAKKKLKNNEKVVLICDHFDPNDLELLTDNNKLKALVTTEGGPSSHMGLVLNVLNIPGVMGISDRQKIRDGDWVTVDSFNGKIYLGQGKIIKSNLDEFAVKVKSEWEKIYGAKNPWSDFLNLNEKDKIYQQFQDNLKKTGAFKSKKAGQTNFINKCFGKDISIYSEILPFDDIEGILKAIERAKEKNKGVWLRSAYTPDLLQSPYTSADITQFSREEVEKWFRDPAAEDNFSKFGNYQAWKKIQAEGQTYEMTYALIPFDEKGKLDKDLATEHFVCSLRCEHGRPTKIIIDIFDGSPHTRTLGQKLPSETMSIIVLANKNIPSKIGQIYYRFGKNLFMDLPQMSTDKKIAKLMAKNGMLGNGGDDYVLAFNKLLENHQLTSLEIAKFVDPRKLGIIKYVADTIIGNWWKNYDIPTRMWALNKITGASVLEVQGRYSEKNNWMLIYGTKGEEENLLVERSR